MMGKDCPLCQGTDEMCPLCKGAGFMKHVLNIPPRYEALRFENYEPLCPDHLKAYEVCQNFVQEFNLEDVRGITLIGFTQTGKTHLMVGVLKALYRDKGVKGLFFDTREMLFQCQRYMDYGKDKYYRFVDFLLNVPVLALDGLYVERLSDVSVETLSLIITHRYNHNLSTLATICFKTAWLDDWNDDVYVIDTLLEKFGKQLSQDVINKLFVVNEVVFLKTEVVKKEREEGRR